MKSHKSISNCGEFALVNPLEIEGFGPNNFLWEKLSNPGFKPLEFERFKNEAGSNYFVLSPQRSIAATHAIGISSTSGRYGGTYAQGLPPSERLLELNEIAITQMRTLLAANSVKRLL